MLNRLDVEREEEWIREQVNQLPEARRKAFYEEVKRKLKDPDTYAALNWFFIAGLHHFYLGRWLNGLVDLAIFATGMLLLMWHYTFCGFALIIGISVWELWALFRSQVIVQDWNNKIYRNVLRQYTENTGEFIDPPA